MRVALEQLDTRGLVVELPKGKDGERQMVALRSAQKLRGTLDREPEKLSLNGVAAEEIIAQSIGVMFGKVRLSEGEFVARALRVEMNRIGDRTILDAKAGAMAAAGSAVDKGDLHIDGQVRAEGFEVHVRDGFGHIEFAEIEVKGFALHDGPTDVVAESVIARNLHIAWGNGFEISAESLVATGVRFSAKGVQLLSEGLSARDGSWKAGRAHVGAASLGETKVSAQLPEGRAGKGGSSKAKLSEVLGSGRMDGYLRILDTLFGHIDVDVQVDMSVPVIGSRRATHEMRVPVDGGSIDYRKLESNLSTLEDALLDFAVRDGALGLELGIPLLPTRGRGKQLVVWDLNERDLALAEQNRVRLAVLPKARRVAERSERRPPEEEGEKPAVELRHVGLANIDVQLGLTHQASDPEAVLKKLKVDDLALRGNVQHEVDGPEEEGELNGALLGLEAQLSHLPLGVNDVSIDAIEIERLADVHVEFLGPQPTHVTAQIGGVELRELMFWRPRAA